MLLLDLHDAVRMVKITPADVPTQIKSLVARSDVTRKQAALCCLMISSQLESILLTVGATFTSNKKLSLRRKNENNILKWFCRLQIATVGTLQYIRFGMKTFDGCGILKRYPYLIIINSHICYWFYVR